MSFEKDFPGLKGKMGNGRFKVCPECGLRRAFSHKDIQDSCLDKLRVREAIERIMITVDGSLGDTPIINSYEVGNNFALERLKKELGLGK